MKRTASATIDRNQSPSPTRRPGCNDLTGTTSLGAALARNNFTEDDSKSKNILAWAGRVKELIGTYDHGQERNMGQLTRATGYSDLLAACGVDSGDVQPAHKTEQTPSTKTTTNYGMNLDPPKPAASPAVNQLAAEKDSEDPTTRHSSLPRNSFSVTARGEDQPRQELRRASSTQDRGRSEFYPDSVQNPLPARRASQTEVKPAAVRDSSRSPDARALLRRSSVGDSPGSASERTSRIGSGVPTSGSGGHHQPRKRLAARSSKESLEKPKAVCSFKQNDEVAEKYSKKPTRDVGKGTASRRGQDHGVGERSTPRTGNDSRLQSVASTANDRRIDDEDRTKYAPRRPPRTSDSDYADPAENDEMPTRRSSDRDLERDRRRPGPTDDVEKDSLESLSEKLSDLDVRRRQEYSDQPRRDQPPSRRVAEHLQRERRLAEPTDVEERDSLESLSQRLSDLDMRRREQARGDRTPPQRLPDRARSTQRSRGREFEHYQHEAGVEELVELEEKESDESLSTDPRRRTKSSPRRANSPPQRPPAARRDESGDGRDRSLPVIGRRRPLSDNGPRDAASSPPSAPAGRGLAAAARTAAPGPPSPRPILRKASPRGSMTAAEKGKKGPFEARRPRRPAIQPAVRAIPAAVVPLRRPVDAAAAAAAAAADDDDEDDYDDDYPDVPLVNHRFTGRGLTKCSAVTDLSDSLQLGSHKFTAAASNKPRGVHVKSQAPIESSSSTSVRSPSPSLTPRRIWQFMHPCVNRVLAGMSYPLASAVQGLCDLFRMPQVVEAGHRMHENWLRVLDDWALFITVTFTAVCMLIVIVLC